MHTHSSYGRLLQPEVTRGNPVLPLFNLMPLSVARAPFVSNHDKNALFLPRRSFITNYDLLIKSDATSSQKGLLSLSGGQNEV